MISAGSPSQSSLLSKGPKFGSDSSSIWVSLSHRCRWKRYIDKSLDVVIVFDLSVIVVVAEFEANIREVRPEEVIAS